MGNSMIRVEMQLQMESNDNLMIGNQGAKSSK